MYRWPNCRRSGEPGSPRPAIPFVTVRIEEEAQAAPAEQFADDALFGMWRDREEMADAVGYVRKLRASRFNDGGTRCEG